MLLSGFINNKKQQEEIETARRFSIFSTQASNTVVNKQILLKGYLAYLETTDLTEQDTIRYLERLMDEKDELIRSVTVIEDTTIRWIYPLSSNQTAIGVDLATVPQQKDIVLRIKNEMKEIIQGPIDLVQGGQGIIIRIPVIKESGIYYGQLSIVLDLEKLASKIQEIANDNELSVHINSNQNGLAILDNEAALSQQPMTFAINDSGLDWTAFVVPLEHWKNIEVLRLLLFLTGGIIALLAGLILYYLLYTNQRLHHLANNDPLTGLYNRRFLDEYQSIVFVRAERYQKIIGFMLLDLNGFKSINDTYGHKIGDEVLVHTARILKEQTRLNESIFRIGGDEFLILFPDLNSDEELKAVVDRILSEFNKPMKIHNAVIIIKPSIGIASYPNDGAEFEQVLHKADQKMYAQKPQNK